MKRKMKTCCFLVAGWLSVVFLFAQSCATDLLQQDVNRIYPEVCTLMKAPGGKPPESALMHGDELLVYLKEMLLEDYPDRDLQKHGECLSMLGLLPDSSNLEQMMIELLKQMAGGLYDYRTKKVIWLESLVPEEQRNINDEMILAHELTHAYQDRYLDFKSRIKACQKNADYEYAFRGLIEGMASLIMLAYANDRPVEQIQDLKNFWKPSFYGNKTPYDARNDYLNEWLISPYAEGGAFIQSWITDHPGNSLSLLFNDPPATSEQVLHYDKYREKDLPCEFNLDKLSPAIPSGWILFYRNSLGEFDVWQLFQAHTKTRNEATELASGWDGLDFICWQIPDGRKILAGISAWDSPQDALEFSAGFSGILADTYGDSALVFRPTPMTAGFIIGLPDVPVRKRISGALLDQFDM